MSTSSVLIRVASALRQVGRAILACLVVAASLLVFPNAVPWLIAVWLLAYTLLVLFRRRGLVCLGACLAILVAKRLTPAPGLLLLMAVMLAVLVLGIRKVRNGESTLSRRFAWPSALLLWIVWAVMAVDWYAATHCHHSVVLKPDQPVVCFGDSMTSLGRFGGYPDDLRPLLSVPVVNAGIGGVSAKRTVEYHLPELLRRNAQVVVIELGAHDFLLGYSRAETKANLKTIIDAVRQAGAEVVLMEIPRAYMSDPYWGLEREIARQEDVELIPDTAMRTLFLRSPMFLPGSWLGEPYFTDEGGIHANARGQVILAAAVAEALVRLYGPQIRADREPAR